MGEERQLQVLRTVLATVGAILFLAILAYNFGFQTLMSWKLRHEANRLPVLNLTPKPLSILSSSPAAGTQLSDAGFSFEVPWGDLDNQKTKTVGLIAVFVFESGRVVSFYPPSPTGGDLLFAAEESFGDKKGNLRQLFGSDVTRTDYIFRRTMLEMTPSQMKPWTSQRDAIRGSFLLLLKGISAVGGETGIFSVSANGWKGFQYDDPTKKPKRVTLELYDSQDRHVEIVFSSGKSDDSAFSQEDINRVLLTLGSTSARSPSSGNSSKVVKAGI